MLFHVGVNPTPFLVFPHIGICLILNFWLRAWTQKKGSTVQIDSKTSNTVQLTILVSPFFSVWTCCLEEWVCFLPPHCVTVYDSLSLHVVSNASTHLLACVLKGFWYNLLSRLTRRPAGVAQTTQAVYTDGHFDTHKKKAQESITQGEQTQPHKQPALARADWVDPENRIMGQQADAIEGRGHGITPPCTLLLHPTSFQMHCYVWSSYSAGFNYKHMITKTTPFKRAP